MRLPGPLRRRAARLIRNVPVRIRSGPNAGRRWSLAVSGRGSRSGAYEADRFDAWARLVRPGDRVWDVGAHYGYAALIAARRAGPSGSLTVFEPSVFNRWYLERHLSWNGVDADVVPVALSDFEGTSRFGGRGGSVAFHLGGEGEVVEVRTVAGVVAAGRPLPQVMKVDVEGAEVGALAGFEEVAAPGAPAGSGAAAGPEAPTEQPLVFLSVHGRELLDPCLSWAADHGYLVLTSTAVERARSGAARWHGDPDVLLIPPDRVTDLDAFCAIPWFAGGAIV